ncbi:ribosome maturation factor RimP [Borreliella yangtzensis]|uniref:Ribosome maturation factor RimP n=1 Tax=Borreliella yangtzensis TaxID=683292 RepID=A0ABR6P931_9SPIR|nr:ribosome maturation factor RimP [Borreliella yangtzensis]MBB6042780.1 ribosome maturation factor RimP [Borreliella yangtzensis]WKC73736.1 ribosome maturation factor RimP [Borreliella yangtzensis]WKC74652.1 ribosome maturation factor RimP [Borreliella yangtzensis]
MIERFDKNNEVYNLIKNLTECANIEILEINIFKNKSIGKIQIVLYSKSFSLGVDLLTDLHKIILLILEANLKYSFTLELSTPGINRKIKSGREFQIFEGRKIKLMLDNEFEEGLILKSKSKSFIFKTDSKELNVFYSDVKKAKLV